MIHSLAHYIFGVGDRVKWFRDRSSRDRAREERQILEEEFKRTIRSYDNLCTTWTRQGESQSDAGRRAYAYKQATMFSKLRSDCESYQQRALKKAQAYDEWFKSYIV